MERWGPVFLLKGVFTAGNPRERGKEMGDGGGRVAKELIFDCRGAGRSGQQAGSLFSQPTLTFEC